jgi:hypothetical protein
MPQVEVNAPSWLTTWSRHWQSRDRAQFDQLVYRCQRCTSAQERPVHQYGYAPVSGDIVLVLACGHFVKQGAPMPSAV